MASRGNGKRNPALNYQFHIILAKQLINQHISLDEVIDKVIENLDKTAPDRHKHKEMHHRVTKDSFEQAKTRSTDIHYLMSYVLDRWSRVTSGSRKPHDLKEMFKHKPDIVKVIDEICKLNLKCHWSECGKNTPVQLEINSKGGLFVLCRDCKNESKKKRTKKSQKVCVITSVNKEEIGKLLRQLPQTSVPASGPSYSRKRSRGTVAESSEESIVEVVTPKPKKVKVDDPDAETESGGNPILSMKTLTLIKWKNSEGTEQKLRIVRSISSKWRNIGNLLGVSHAVLETIYSRYQDLEEYCDAVLRNWLDNGSTDYPSTWNGLIKLLDDADCAQVAETLRQFIIPESTE